MTAPHTATLADIMSRNLVTVTPQTTLRDAAHAMAGEGVSCLLVVLQEKGCGIVTESDIVRALHEGRGLTTAVGEFMTQPLITARPGLDLSSARQLVESHRIRHLPVADGDGNLLGIVSDTNFRLALGNAYFQHLHTLSGVMDRNILHLPPTARLDEAIARMAECGIDYLLVSENGKPIGILTERDVPRLVRDHAELHGIPLSEAMSSPVRGIGPNESITAALEAMSRFKLRHMAVLDAAGSLLGIVSQRRLFEQLAHNQLESDLQRISLERDHLLLEAHLQLALDATGGGSWEYRHDEDRLIASSGLLALLGCAEGEAPMTMADWRGRIHPDDLDVFDAARGADSRQMHVVEYRIRHADGTWRDYVVVNPREVAIEHPPPLGWVPYELAEGYLVRPPRQLVIRMVPQPFGVPLTVAEQPRQEPPEPPRNVAIRIAQALHEAHEGTRSLPVAWEELPIEMRAQLTNLAAELLRRRVILPGDGQ